LAGGSDDYNRHPDFCKLLFHLMENKYLWKSLQNSFRKFVTNWQFGSLSIREVQEFFKAKIFLIGR
jgi:lysylphosphatidylglycerol synthetase-like protein (DUF2156 family)